MNDPGQHFENTEEKAGCGLPYCFGMTENTHVRREWLHPNNMQNNALFNAEQCKYQNIQCTILGLFISEKILS